MQQQAVEYQDIIMKLGKLDEKSLILVKNNVDVLLAREEMERQERAVEQS